MSYPRTHYLFISHAWRYDDDYKRMINLPNEAPSFSYRNYSVPRHDPEIAINAAALQNALDDQMRSAQVVIVLAGMYVHYSDWIQYEMDRAYQWNKPILAVEPWGSPRIPAVIKQYASEVVGWNTDSVTGAIRRLTP